MKKAAAVRQQDVEKKVEPKKPSARPLVPTNKALPRGLPTQQLKSEKGSCPPRSKSRLQANTANKENISKATPRAGDDKAALPRLRGTASTQAPVTRATSRLNSQGSLKATPSQSTSLQVRRPALTTADKLLDNFDDLTVEFETLKRQSLRASISGSAIRQATMQPAARAVPAHRMATAALHKAAAAKTSSCHKSITDLAEELFDEPGFLDLCGKAMNTNLQRTRDGATAESRVQELAGTP